MKKKCRVTKGILISSLIYASSQLITILLELLILFVPNLSNNTYNLIGIINYSLLLIKSISFIILIVWIYKVLTIIIDAALIIINKNN